MQLTLEREPSELRFWQPTIRLKKLCNWDVQVGADA